jgi:Tfp pilus assembly protein PilN
MKLRLNLASRVHVDPWALYLAHVFLLGVLTLVLVLNLWYLQKVRTRGVEVRAELAQSGRLETNSETPAEELTPAMRQRLEREIAMANSILVREGFRWTELLGRLEEVGTPGVSLQAIQPNYHEGSLRISGIARGTVALGNYLDSLIASPGFTDVFLLTQEGVRVRSAQGQEIQAVGFTLLLKGAF